MLYIGVFTVYGCCSVKLSMTFISLSVAPTDEEEEGLVQEVEAKPMPAHHVPPEVSDYVVMFGRFVSSLLMVNNSSFWKCTLLLCSYIGNELF